MERKICSNCKSEKDVVEFHYKKTENRYHSWCKNCLYSFQMIRWKDRKKEAIKLLGEKCCKCGYDKNISALHFHHIDPKKKDFNWTKCRLQKWSRVIEELKKCILVCANCHAEIHSPDNTDIKDGGNGNVSLNREETIIVSNGKCPICDSDVFGTKYCSKICSAKASRKVKDRPSKEEILKKMETMSMVSIGQEYGVSDNAIRKWIK